MSADTPERAKVIAQVIYHALEKAPAVLVDVGASWLRQAEPASAPTPHFTIKRQGGCMSCDPGSCWECGYLFSGERITIYHDEKGERVLSDRTLHLLTHGITRYPTKYVVYGEPVVVDLDIDELGSYLDM